MFYKKNFMCLMMVLVIASFPVDSLISQTWKKVPGTNNYVNFLRFSQYDKEKLFVGSDAVETDFSSNNINFPFFGYGYQTSTNSGQTFSESMLTDYSIWDIIESPSDKNLLLISARKQDIGKIFLSSDGGISWDEETKRCESSSQITRFYGIKDGDHDTFYASMINSENGFRYTNDNFVSCLSVEGTKVNARDLAVSKKNPSVMYLVADNVSKFHVLFSSDKGQTWNDRSSSLENYRILSVQTSPLNEAIVIVGADSISPTGKIIGMGIFYSDDYGMNWKNVGAMGASVYDIQFHPTDSKFWAAAGGDKGVFISGTGGDYWELSTDGLPEDLFARKIAIPDINTTSEGIYVYASIYGNGIYKSERITTSVNDEENSNNNLISGIYPNVVNEWFSVNVKNNSNTLNYEIYDILGNVVNLGSINGNSIIDVMELSTGTYFVKFTDTKQIQYLKFIKN